jgi:hypothetical protein
MNLFELTKLAKVDLPQTEELLSAFIQKKFALTVQVQINQSAVSLNSVNGTLILADGEKMFFKFHAEEGEAETQSEYYNGKILAKHGFDIIEPLYQSTDVGEQFLIYPYITAPTFFEVCDTLDAQYLSNNNYDESLKKSVLIAERNFCETCVKVAQKTFAVTSSNIVATEPIWQLFSTRLVSKNNEIPRLDLYYQNQKIQLPDGSEILFKDLANKKWIINGRTFDQSLSEIIIQSKKIICSESCKEWGTIVAHGDDHNGNKFFDQKKSSLTYFDPAFAGQNIPALLAFIKTIFHDTLAHPFWLYTPKKIDPETKLDWTITEKSVVINHNVDLSVISPLRSDLLTIKLEYLLKPIVQMLRQKKLLPTNALDFIKKALFCCPFLVLNLINYQKYSPKMSLLALSKAVEMGSLSDKDNSLDASLRDMFLPIS